MDLLSSGIVYGIGRWLGVITILALLFDFALMEWAKYKASQMKEILASRIYANKFHCIVSGVILLLAILHGLILMLGHWSTFASPYVVWMDDSAPNSIPLMVNLGTVTAGLMVLLGLQGIFKHRWWKMWGMKSWRRVHFWLTLIVILLGITHGITIGKDLAWVGLSIR